MAIAMGPRRTGALKRSPRPTAAAFRARRSASFARGPGESELSLTEQNLPEDAKSTSTKNSVPDGVWRNSSPPPARTFQACLTGASTVRNHRLWPAAIYEKSDVRNRAVRPSPGPQLTSRSAVQGKFTKAEIRINKTLSVP